MSGRAHKNPPPGVEVPGKAWKWSDIDDVLYLRCICYVSFLISGVMAVAGWMGAAGLYWAGALVGLCILKHGEMS